MSQTIADTRLARIGAVLCKLPPSPLANELAAALAQGTGALATELRVEIAAWDELLIYLDTLGKSRFLPQSIDVAILSEPLASARAEARSVLDALVVLDGSSAGAGFSPSPPALGGRGQGEGDSARGRTKSPLTLPSPPAKPGGEGKERRGNESVFPPLSRLCGRGAGGEGVGRDLPKTLTPNPSPAKPGEGDKKSAPQRKPSNQLQIRCHACGESGAINWDRLNHIQNCRHCSRHFAVRADGHAVEVIKSAGDRWRPKRGRNSLFRPRPRRWLIAATLLLALPLVATAGWRMVRPAAVIAAELELPRELTPRAEAFSRAWLASDVRTMKRLTSPAQDRVLYGWFAHHRPPVLAPASIEPPHIDVAVQSVKADQTVLRVRVAGKSSVELTQTWERRGENWFFLPPAK
jgi:hypothetical protein